MAAWSLDAIIKRGRRVRSIIRLRPFDTSTIDGRSNERLRRVFWTATTASLAKGVNTLTMLVAVPITLAYLGVERYGLWMAITSAVAFLGVADLGIGNGVLNLVSEANGRNDTQGARKCVSSAFFLLSGVAIFLAIVFAFIYGHIVWDRLFNVSSAAGREAGQAVAVFVACILVNLPLSIISRVRWGYQEGYFNSLWQGTANLLGLGGLVVVVRLRAGLPWLILTIAAAPLVENIFNGISLFAFRRPWLIPRPRLAESSLAWRVMRVGFLFLLIQLANVTLYYADNIIITRVLGPEAVTRYAVPVRLFSILPGILWMFLSPLWPAYGEATARGDDQWVKATLIRAVSATLALCLSWSLLLIGFGDTILRIWTGGRVPFSRPLMLALGLSTTLTTVVTAIALFLNAVNKIRFQVFFSLSAALLSTVGKVVLVRSSGLTGIVWANIAVTFFVMLIPYSLYVSKRYSRRISEARCDPT
jgi:O-antigen/teichoic acid export membrane protein